MIRIGLPPPMSARLRARSHAVQTEFARKNQDIRETFERWSASLRSRRERIRASWNLRARAEARRAALFAEFAEKYDDLTDLLCDSAREGVAERDEARYAELRRILRSHYRALRGGLRAHWEDAPEAADPFEAMFGPERLSDIVNAENGIESMLRSRQALEACREAALSERSA